MPTSDAPSDRDDETEKDEEREGTFRHGDLYKMHTYRDAIPKAQSAWVLYPGDETRFFSEEGHVAREVNDLPAKFCGVGAIPLQPAEDATSALRSAVNALLGSTGPV